MIMPPKQETLLKEIEERLTQLELNRLNFPLDPTSKSILKREVDGILNTRVDLFLWKQTCAFTITDADTVSWGAGSLISASGDTYSISAGNTGNMSVKTYIYLDVNTSVTAYQISTTASDAVGIGKVLIAVAQNGSTQAKVWEMNGTTLVNVTDITDAGALASKSSVDLATGEVTNKTGANITYTSGGGTLDSLKPAEVGADVTTGKDLNVLANRTADKISYTAGGTVDSLKPAEASATVGAKAGTNLKDSNNNSIADNDILNIIRSETAGEAINASTTPQAVYKDTTDGKMYLTDANDSTLGHRRFYGFVADSQNLATNDTGYVRVQGKVAGFTGLTSGQFLYLSDTAGAISHTPSTTMVVRVGIATSATEVLVLQKGLKMIVGSASVSSAADLTTTITLGFKPKLILCACIASPFAGHKFSGTGFWSDSSGQMWSGAATNCSTNVVSESSYIIRTDALESHADDRQVTITNVTETAFDIFFDYLLTSGNVNTATVNYVAFGE